MSESKKESTLKTRLTIIGLCLLIGASGVYFFKPAAQMVLGLFEEKPGPYDVVEDLDEYPYKVTVLPYEMQMRSGNLLAWADNETLLFIEKTSKKETGFHSRLSQWSEKEGYKTIRNNILTVCARDGFVGYLEAGKPKKRHFGLFGQVKQLPETQYIDTNLCIPFPAGEKSYIPSELPVGGHIIRSLDPDMFFWKTDAVKDRVSGKVLKNDQFFSTLPFRGLWTLSMKYIDHMDQYFLDKVINELCTEDKCEWKNHHYSFFVNPEGKPTSIKWDLPWLYTTASRPWFEVYPLTQHRYLFLGSDRISTSHPFKDVGLDLVDLKTKETHLLVKGAPFSVDVSPNGCKVAVSRKVTGVNAKAKGRSIQIAVIDLCQPNPKYKP